MPGFFRRLFGLKSKSKLKVPKFKNSSEYFEWKAKVMGKRALSEAMEAERERIAILKKGKIDTKKTIEDDLRHMSYEVSNKINGQNKKTQ